MRSLRQPTLSRAVRTRPALVAGQLLTGDQERDIESRWWQLAMRNTVRDNVNRQFLGVADGFLSGVPVGHDARQFEGLRDPAAVVFPVAASGEIYNRGPVGLLVPGPLAVLPSLPAEGRSVFQSGASTELASALKCPPIGRIPELMQRPVAVRADHDQILQSCRPTLAP